MRFASGLSVLAVTGCLATVDPPTPIPLRNPTAPVASQAGLALSEIAGVWRITHSAGALTGDTVTLGAEQIQLGTQVVRARYLGDGRFETDAGPIWVHWRDTNGRTLAIGDPGGRFFAVLDQTEVSADRLTAATQILDWYGYDTSRLEAQ